MTQISNASESNAWPFIEAKKLLERAETSGKNHIIFETGYGPSGLPHIGTFGEVARTSMVLTAFEKISNIPAKIICFSDDMDGMRKVPTNLPNQDMLKNYLGMPLTRVPDPYGEMESFGHYMNAKLRSFLDRFSFKYEFMSATQCYKSGYFDHMLIKVLEKYDEIMNIMLPTLRDERRATYSPFMPICPQTGRVLQVKIERVDKVNNSVIYKDENGTEVEISVTLGNCKLQWKPDFGMRWAALGVDYEMYGKEHMPNGPLYSEICKVLGGVPPVQFFFELFLDEKGAKISKSVGNSITIDEWLTYAPLESLSLFMYQSPSKAKRLYFDVIPKCVDEYLTFNRKYHEEIDNIKKLSNPAYHIHQGNVPKIEMYGISFGILLNLASVCNPDSKQVLWNFISQYAPEASPETSPFLDQLVGLAINYYNDFVKANKKYIEPNQAQQVILGRLRDLLENIPMDTTAEEIQTKIYDIGMEAGYANLRDYFKELYQILLGQEEGPRLGTFIKLFGIRESLNLIKQKIS